MNELNRTELEAKDLKELLAMAKQMELGQDEIDPNNKQNVIFKILEAQAKKNGLLFSEGVLESLDDGFVAVRSGEHFIIAAVFPEVFGSGFENNVEKVIF